MGAITIRGFINFQYEPPVEAELKKIFDDWKEADEKRKKRTADQAQLQASLPAIKKPRTLDQYFQKKE